MITDNPALANDQAYALRDAIGLASIGGGVEIRENEEP